MKPNCPYPFPTIPSNLPNSFKGLGSASARYPYTNHDGEIISLVLRFDNDDKSDKSRKEFRPYTPSTDQWKAPKVRPLYRLDLIASVSGHVVLVEGEKCADALNAIGILATTAFGGSNAVGKTDFSPLINRDIIIWPDNDDAGFKYAKDALVMLSNIGAKSIRNVNITKLKPIQNDSNLRGDLWLTQPTPSQPRGCPTPIDLGCSRSTRGKASIGYGDLPIMCHTLRDGMWQMPF